ncbi:Divergent polysaccharide deacetylase [Serratia rubidaea]|uniref:Divergent polysaccharide deacetylase n=1 Tax=Serratia rubidaea TaxID=61652 RepID=A0A4V6JIK7_SERRU|nr:Divergent polysaccharide deacetylase [Serratia rubidaea]
MSSAEVQRIIRNAVSNVPYAVGMNNHMGSAMTSSLPAMQKVMQALESYNLYFLDSMTIGNSQATRAAAGTGVKVIKRRVFLDDTASESDIRHQFNRAIELARRNGSTIAIGHPRPATVKVLKQMLATLPGDIELVRPSSLLNAPQGGGYLPPSKPPRPTQPKKSVQKRHQAVQSEGAEDAGKSARRYGAGGHWRKHRAVAGGDLYQAALAKLAAHVRKTVIIQGGACSALLLSHQSQLSTTFPDCPERMASKPCWNSSIEKRWVMIGVRSRPDWISAAILYQVSNISRP